MHGALKVTRFYNKPRVKPLRIDTTGSGEYKKKKAELQHIPNVRTTMALFQGDFKPQNNLLCGNDNTVNRLQV